MRSSRGPYGVVTTLVPTFQLVKQRHRWLQLMQTGRALTCPTCSWKVQDPSLGSSQGSGEGDDGSLRSSAGFGDRTRTLESLAVPSSWQPPHLHKPHTGYGAGRSKTQPWGEPTPRGPGARGHQALPPQPPQASLMNLAQALRTGAGEEDAGRKAGTLRMEGPQEGRIRLAFVGRVERA